jgi:short-subunit dehydrogenase
VRNSSSVSVWSRRFGPWAVVTGASEGIGRAFAIALAERGLNLVLCARRSEVLERLRAELNEKAGVQVSVCVADLSTPAGVEALVAHASKLEVGLLVESAGFGTSGPFIASDLAVELNMIDLNCRAVAALGYHFGRRFAEQGHGGLVLLSSLLAFQGVPRAANYAATKAYVQTFAEGLTRELRPKGVAVIASAPGPILSGFGRRADMRMSFGLPPEAVATGTLRALGRLGTVRPGWLSKLLEWSLALLPRGGRVRAMGLVMNGMTKHRAA